VEAKPHCLLKLGALVKQLCQLEPPPPSVARGGDNLSLDESPIEAPHLSQIYRPLAFSTMSTLFPLQDVITAALARRYPERSNRSPFFTPPPQKKNAMSLVDGYDMTPLGHLSPATATLDQIRYAQEHIGGDEYKNCEYDDNFQKMGIIKIAVRMNKPLVVAISR